MSAKQSLNFNIPQIVDIGEGWVALPVALNQLSKAVGSNTIANRILRKSLVSGVLKSRSELFLRDYAIGEVLSLSAVKIISDKIFGFISLSKSVSIKRSFWSKSSHRRYISSNRAENIFSVVTLSQSLSQFADSKEFFQTPNVRETAYNVYVDEKCFLSIFDQESAIFGKKNNAKMKRGNYNKYTAHDWDTILLPFRSLIEKGTFESTFGKVDVRGTRAKIIETILESIHDVASQSTARRKADMLIVELRKNQQSH